LRKKRAGPQDQQGQQSKEKAKEELAGEKFEHVIGIDANSEKNRREERSTLEVAQAMQWLLNLIQLVPDVPMEGAE
jgi:hypothetical protein